MTQMELFVCASGKVNGIEMGVLSDGNVYLSGRSLSELCGVKNSSLSEATTEWSSPVLKTRLAKWLVQQGFSRDSLYTKTSIPGVAGNVVYAYQEDICRLVLAYYATEVGTAEAKKNLLTFLQAGLRAFVYSALKFDPARATEIAWQNFRDRLQLSNEPPGYFSILKEGASLVLAAIQAGLQVDHRTIPDIAIGRAWSAHWKAQGLAEKHGPAGAHDHNYPPYYPQAASNPQEVRVYPVQALGDFRIWMQEIFIPTHLPKYLKGQITKGALTERAAQALLAATSPKALPAAR